MIVLAATTPERIGFFVAAATIVGWAVYVAIAARQRDATAPVGSEIELAPNRKAYFDDDALEGPRLERFLGWGLVLITLCSLGPVAYWLNEPSRQAGAVEEFDQKAIGRGHSLFQPTDSPEHGAHFGCATCHGSEGQGGPAKYTFTDETGKIRQVTWKAPRLDTALLKFSPEEVRVILEYGRPNSPMPAWGAKGGGPMNDQQLDDLVAYIRSIQKKPDEARAIALKEAQAEAEKTGLPASSGEVLFRTNCARCHTKGWSFDEPDVMGGGALGPSLIDGATLRQFPDVKSHIEFIGIGSEFGKPYGTRGIGGNEGGGMPGFQLVLTPEQIKAIVEYERGL